MTPNGTSILTAAEAGEILGCSARTVIRKAEADPPELPFVRKLPGPNGDYLFDRAAVEELKAAKDAEAVAS